MIIIEKWKTIPNFSNYEVSNKGRVLSKAHEYLRIDGISGFRKEKMLSSKRKSRSEYINLVLKSDSGDRVNVNLHRIVATVFVKRENDTHDIVNHIDGNKHNNIAENLEWTTHSQNNKHAYETGLKKPASKRCSITKKYGTYEEYNSLRELCLSEGIKIGTATSSIHRNSLLKNGSKIKYI